MKRLSRVLCILVFCSTAASGMTRQGDPDPLLVVVTDSALNAYRIDAEGATQVWTVSGAFGSGPFVVPDGSRAIVLVGSGAGVHAYDAATGHSQWTLPISGALSLGMEIGSFVDAQRQYYTNEVLFPDGPPRFQASPLVAIGDFGVGASTIHLLDSRDGSIHWSSSFPFEAYPAGFLRTPSGQHDVLVRGAKIGRLDATTGAGRWWLSEPHRTLVPIGDLNGDGQWDLVSRANWSSVLKWYDGLTGALIDTHTYASFDILGLAVIADANNSACSFDLIAAAQGCTGVGGGGALFRRSACPQTPDLQWDSTGFCNQTMLGLIPHVSGWTVLSGWRHQSKVLAVDALTGTTRWLIEATIDADHAAVGATDLTGDGNDDVFVLHATGLRLHDGLSGSVVPTFAPLTAQRAAVWTRKEPGSVYCFGDGGGSSCPCGNFAAQGAGCLNSTGQGAILGASGTASVGAEDLVLQAAGLVPAQAGLYLQGSQIVNAGWGVPFGDGLRCAGGSVIRLQVRSADAGGYSQTTVPIASLGGVSPTQTRYYQVWYRDALGSPCGSGFNLTNGLRVTWLP